MGKSQNSFLNSDERLNFLGDISDSTAREVFIKQAEQAGFKGVKVAEIKSEATFHNGEELSPVAGIALNKEGEILVTDEFNHRVILYSATGELKKTVGSKGSGDGEFHYPRGIAVGAGGLIYIADAWNHRIVVLNDDLSFKQSFGKLGSGEGELDEPVDLTFTGGTLAVLEKSNHRIHLFKPDGTPLGSIGKRGSAEEQHAFYSSPPNYEIFSPPVFEFPSSITADNSGNLYVADTNNHRLIKINSDYTADTTFSALSTRHPSGITVDESSNLHVTEFNNDSIKVFSPNGIHLYSYGSGMEVPLSILSSNGKVFVGDGIKTAVKVINHYPSHDRKFSADTPFNKNMKMGISLIKDGNWKEGLPALEQASTCKVALDGKELGYALPESDAVFPQLAESDRLQEPSGFLKFLEKISAELLAELQTDIADKISAIDNLTSALLSLEKVSDSSRASADDLLVAQYKATKIMLSKSSEIKQKLSSFKKIQEFWRRLIFGKESADKRTSAMLRQMETVMELRASREEWYRGAEQEAPKLTFISPANDRAIFVQNFRRLEYTTFEFQVLGEQIAEQNRECASLMQKKFIDEEKIIEFASASLDFFALYPETLVLINDYLQSLKILFESAGDELSIKVAGKTAKKELWGALAENDVIQPSEESRFGLYSSLWSKNKIKNEDEVTSPEWGGISQFYISEFNRYIKENDPLRIEMIKQTQLFPIAEKVDPAQTITIDRKRTLLGFHLYFQERYIAGVMKEYLLRFALFSLDAPAITKEAQKTTLDEINKLRSETANAHYRDDTKTSKSNVKVVSADSAQEKNKHRMDSAVTTSHALYYECLSSFLELASAKVDYSLNGDGAIQPKFIFKQEPYMAGKISSAIDVASDEEFIYLLAMGERKVFILDKKWKFVKSFGTTGSLPGGFAVPVSITVTPDGNLMIADSKRSLLHLFTKTGTFIKDIILEGSKRGGAFRVAFDSDNSFWLSFVDGSGLSRYDTRGKEILAITADSDAGKDIKIFFGLCVVGNRVFTAGNGKFVSFDTDGNNCNSINIGGSEDEEFTSLTHDGKGKIYAVEHKSNKLYRVDKELTSVETVRLLPTQRAIAIDADKESLIVADLLAGAFYSYDII